MHVQSCCFALSSYCLFHFLVAAASVTSYHLRYFVMSHKQTKQNIPGANWIAPADTTPNVHPKRFFDSSVVPSLLVRKVENISFPCSHKLGERTGQVWQHNSRRVRTQEKNSGETVRRLGTIIQSMFCAQSGAGIRLNFWKYLGESQYPGALSPVLENFRRALSPDPTDCPWVSEDGFIMTIECKWAQVLSTLRSVTWAGLSKQTTNKTLCERILGRTKLTCLSSLI